MSSRASGTEGYADEAEELFKLYESIPAADLHRAVLHLIPTAPSHILDIGSGTGRDAAWFAAQGHRVVAVEPTDAMRMPAMALHPSPLIEWLDDSLPDLALLLARGEKFDVVMLTAVWMHLDAEQRRRAIPNLAKRCSNGHRSPATPELWRADPDAFLELPPLMPSAHAALRKHQSCRSIQAMTSNGNTALLWTAFETGVDS